MAEKEKQGKTENKEKTKNEPKTQTSSHGFYHYIKEAWKHPSEQFIKDQRADMALWAAGQRITKLEKPTRLDRARELGYKAKKGILVFRVCIQRGGRQKPRPTTKRRSKRFNTKKILKMSYQWVAEQRLQHKYRNLEVLNSYKIGKNGKYYFFEIIAIDPYMPEIKSDPQFSWITKPSNKFRVFRGLTSSAKKSRGLSTKSRNLKVRPSSASWNNKGR